MRRTTSLLRRIVPIVLLFFVTGAFRGEGVVRRIAGKVFSRDVLLFVSYGAFIGFAEVRRSWGYVGATGRTCTRHAVETRTLSRRGE